MLHCRYSVDSKTKQQQPTTTTTTQKSYEIYAGNDRK